MPIAVIPTIPRITRTFATLEEAPQSLAFELRVNWPTLRRCPHLFLKAAQCEVVDLIGTPDPASCHV